MIKNFIKDKNFYLYFLLFIVFIFLIVISSYYFSVVIFNVDTVYTFDKETATNLYPQAVLSVQNLEQTDNQFFTLHNDPMIYISPPKLKISSTMIEFAEPISIDSRVQIFYAKKDENLGEENSVIASLKKGSSKIIINLPSAVYAILRYDIDIFNETYEIQGIYVSEGRASRVIFWPKELFLLLIIICLIIVLWFLWKKTDSYRKFILSDPIPKIQKLICVFVSSFGLWKVFFNSQQSEFIKSIIAIFLLLLCFRFIKEPRKCHFNNKVIIWFFSAFLAIFIVIGSIAVKNVTVFENIKTINLLSMIFSIIGIWMVIINIVNFSINISSKYSIEYSPEKKLEGKLFYISWFLLFIFWFPYLLAYYPGHMSVDSTNQWMQAVGFIKMNSANPILHTFLIKICQKIGGILSENINFQVAIYSFIQLNLMAAIFSYAITWLKKYNTPSVICCFVFIWFAMHPIFGSYGIMMWKDVLSGSFVLSEMLCIADITLSNGKCLKNIFYIIFWLITTILCCLFRQNVMYAIVFTLFLLPFVINNKLRKKLAIYCMCLIIIVISINYLIVKKYSGSESFLTIPVQQISRTVAHDGIISDNDRMAIEKIVSLEDIKKKYVFWYSDPTVGLFNIKIKEVKKWQYIKLWGSLFLKNPAIYIDAFIYQTYGFWYPLVLNRDYIEKGINSKYSEQKQFDLKITQEPKSVFFNKFLNNFLLLTRFPGIAIIWGIGFHIILIVYCGIILWIRGNKQLLSCLLPCLSIWGTLLISTPLYIEWRYAFSFFTTLPILIVIAFFNISSNKESMKV